jgi:hypothetical protein
MSTTLNIARFAFFLPWLPQKFFPQGSRAGPGPVPGPTRRKDPPKRPPQSRPAAPGDPGAAKKVVKW